MSARPRRSPPPSPTKTCAKVCKRRSVSASRGPPWTAPSDTLSAARKTAVLQGFFYVESRVTSNAGTRAGAGVVGLRAGLVFREGHHGPGGPRAGAAAARHVHRL